MTSLALAPPDMRRSVEAAVPALGGQVWEPLRGGRTNWVWRVGARVVKLYNAAAESPLFPNDPQAEQRALSVVAPLGLGPVLRQQGLDWVVYDHLDGQIWDADDPAPVARLFAAVHALPGEGFRSVASGTAAILAQAEAILAECAGHLPPREGLVEVPPADETCMIHGDAVAGNIIDGPGGLRLIDWQCPGQGDAAEDLAAFLSPAMQWLYRGAVLSAGQVEAFLAAYPDRAVVARYRALRPAFQFRMAAHCLWKAERGAEDYLRALTLELA